MSFDGSNKLKLPNSSTDQTPKAPTAYVPAVTIGAPGEIGGTTPAPGTFTDLTAATLNVTGAVTLGDTLTLTAGLTLNGNVAIGDNASDTLDINATISDDVLVGTTKKIQFRDTGIYINSGADGKVTISSDGSGVDDITLSGTITLDDDLITPTSKKVQFRDSALFINSSVDGQMDIDADVELEITAPTLDINASTLVDISNALTVGGLLTLALGGKLTGVAATATADGLTTGTIPDGQALTIAANGGSVNNIIQLPAATVGSFGFIYTTGGLELRTPTPASISINGGSGASAESAVPSGALIFFMYVTTTALLALQIASNGTVSGVEAAA